MQEITKQPKMFVDSGTSTVTQCKSLHLFFTYNYYKRSSRNAAKRNSAMLPMPDALVNTLICVGAIAIHQTIFRKGTFDHFILPGSVHKA